MSEYKHRMETQLQEAISCLNDSKHSVKEAGVIAIFLIAKEECTADLIKSEIVNLLLERTSKLDCSLAFQGIAATEHGAKIIAKQNVIPTLLDVLVDHDAATDRQYCIWALQGIARSETGASLFKAEDAAFLKVRLAIDPEFDIRNDIASFFQTILKHATPKKRQELLPAEDIGFLEQLAQNNDELNVVLELMTPQDRRSAKLADLAP